MHLRALDYVFWLGAPVAQIGVVTFMLRRGLHRDYPYFFNYTILEVLSAVFLMAVKKLPYTYYFGYWISITLSVLLSFVVLQEIFTDAFRPFENLRDLSVILFRWSGLVVLLVVGMSAITSTHTDNIDAITSTILLVERNVRVMQCGLVFFLLLFSEYLGISRRHVLFGIALGFGIFAAVNMLVATAIAHGGPVKTSSLRELNSGAYLLATLVWLSYTGSRWSVCTGKALNEVSASEPREWNEALTEARTQTPPESVLDTMDRTVEQLLYPRERAKVAAK